MKEFGVNDARRLVNKYHIDNEKDYNDLIEKIESAALAGKEFIFVPSLSVVVRLQITGLGYDICHYEDQDRIYWGS